MPHPTKGRAMSRYGHEPAWDARGDPTAGNARYAILPGTAVHDLRLTLLQMRILGHLGRFNQRRGWAIMNQAELGEWFGVHRQAVNNAIRGLVHMGYVERRPQKDTREAYCLYRIMIDPPDTVVSAGSDTATVSAQADTDVRSDQTLVDVGDGHHSLYSDLIDLTAAATRARTREDLDQLQQRLKEAAGDALDPTAPGLAHLGVPAGWIEQGFDLELDILPAIQDVAARPRRGRIRSWTYFARRVAEVHAERTAPLPAPDAQPRAHAETANDRAQRELMERLMGRKPA